MTLLKKPCKIIYEESFVEDLQTIMLYIARTLQNVKASKDFLAAVKKRVKQRSYAPDNYEKYHGTNDVVYYRAYVGNYVMYYTYVDDVMYLKRLLYGGSKRDSVM